jgi:hypothetical protein
MIPTALHVTTYWFFKKFLTVPAVQKVPVYLFDAGVPEINRLCLEQESFPSDQTRSRGRRGDGGGWGWWRGHLLSAAAKRLKPSVSYPNRDWFGPPG